MPFAHVSNSVKLVYTSTRRFKCLVFISLFSTEVSFSCSVFNDFRITVQLNENTVIKFVDIRGRP